MKVWFWCPCCQRAFQGDVPEPRPRGSRSPGVVGISEVFTVGCPFEDCRATARCIMSWPTVRKWAEISYGASLPTVPVSGQTYEMPPADAPRPAEIAGP